MKVESVLLLDVGSASVAAAIGKKDADGRVVLSHTERALLQNASGANTAAIVSLALDALKKSLEGMRAAALTPKAAHVFLAAPWYKAHVVSVASQSEKPIKIGQGTVEKALNDYNTKYEKASNSSVSQIESVVTERYVNGYPTTLEKSVYGTSLKIELYESEADLPFMQSIEESVRRIFPGIGLSFHSFPLAAFAVLRATRTEESFIIVDAGGEITDVAIVRQGAIVFSGSFPTGSLSLLRGIAGSGSLADAASRLSLYVRGELSEEASGAFASVFQKASTAWNTGYEALLQTALIETPLPNTTFLFSGSEELYWFERMLTELTTAFPVHPVLITPDFFQQSVRLDEKGVYDSFLSTAALYALRVRTGYT